MKKIKCPCCKRERIVEDDVVFSVCYVCQRTMEKVETTGVEDGS